MHVKHKFLIVLVERNYSVRNYMFKIDIKKEAFAQTCSVKKVFLEISQNSQESTCDVCNFIKKETLAQMFSCEFCEILKNTFFYRTPLVATSD